LRCQFEGTAAAAVWPTRADVGDQRGLWRRWNHVNDERLVQRNAYFRA
jgi:hypothetical protein